jgi:hypothetical protein
MTGPIEIAYAALAQAVQGALVASGFSATGGLEIDPTGPFQPSGDETQIVTAAALVQIRTEAVTTFLGAPKPRYVVERTVNLELAAAGADEIARLRTVDAALRACAAIALDAPSLGGAAERVMVLGRDDDDLPPNGTKQVLGFILRVRANDPLGMS